MNDVNKALTWVDRVQEGPGGSHETGKGATEGKIGRVAAATGLCRAAREE
jgi:hypothetical protein